MKRIALLLLASFALAGCGQDSPAPKGKLLGAWKSSSGPAVEAAIYAGGSGNKSWPDLLVLTVNGESHVRFGECREWDNNGVHLRSFIADPVHVIPESFGGGVVAFDVAHSAPDGRFYLNTLFVGVPGVDEHTILDAKK